MRKSEEAQTLQNELREIVSGELSGTADAIQKTARTNPQLTRYCDFCCPQKIRRLLLTPSKSWGIVEVRWAKEILARIKQLEQDGSSAATLGLACLGVGRDDLAQAMSMLTGKPVGAVVVPESVPRSPKKEEKKTKPQWGKETDDTNDDGDEALDETTMGQLEALRVEASKLRS